ncbi:MAG TPA: carboxypeptidase-like regulatory domain-containing protein [Polyangia bacterium]|nr:carboxypeptidase-like regulatory domain-containing protein [Polyangia bacterium]
MRVQGQVTGAVAPSFTWSWTVSLADGSPVPVTIVGANDPSLVEFPMMSFGTYTIAVELASPTAQSCTGLRTITAARPAGTVASFRLHVTPPSTELVPEQDLERQIVGGTPSGGNVLALDPGSVVSFEFEHGAAGEDLPSYVRLTESTSGAIVETRTLSGPSAVRVAHGMYRTLIVPDGDVAPITYPARAPADIGTSPLSLDDGAVVAGTVTDANDRPITGATIVLRAGDLVSTTGTSDAAGAFHLHARAGTFAVTVVSALAAGGLEATVDGLVIDDATTPAPLAIKVAPGALATGSVALMASDPTSLTTATRITLATMAPLANVGTLAVGSGAPETMTGIVRFSLHPATDGTVTTGGVPRGLYLLTVFPSSAMATDGVTTTMVDLTAGDVGPLTVSLSQKVMLRGRLLPTNLSDGVQIVALDEGGLPVVSRGATGPGGLFEILVSPLRSYAIDALPGPDQSFARASFPVVTVADVDVTVPDRSMPEALLYAGRVVDPSLQGVGTALVQAFCETTSAGCTDLGAPVAETVTRSDGTFQLMLPDPDGTP